MEVFALTNEGLSIPNEKPFRKTENKKPLKET
jgi:hypothetical protein